MGHELYPTLGQQQSVRARSAGWTGVAHTVQRITLLLCSCMEFEGHFCPSGRAARFFCQLGLAALPRGLKRISVVILGVQTIASRFIIQEMSPPNANSRCRVCYSSSIIEGGNGKKEVKVHTRPQPGSANFPCTPDCPHLKLHLNDCLKSHHAALSSFCSTNRANALTSISLL